MANLQQVSFTSPFSAEQESISRNRRLAEQLRQQADTPIQSGNMAGGYFVATNPLQYLAQALKGYGASKGMRNADQQERELATRIEGARSGEMQGIIKALQGTPERPAMLDPQEREQSADQGTALPSTMPAVPGDPNQAAIAALGSQFGDIRGMAPGLMNIAETRQNRTEDRAFRSQEAQAARDARAQDLQLRLQDQRIQGAERAALQRELAQMQIDGRRDLATMAAQMRPAPAPSAPIVTDTGIYERNRDGTLRQLTDPATGRPLQPKPSGNAKGKTDVDATMDVYRAASEGLITGLQGTPTGAIAGRIPAVTTAQQTAEGAEAAMAPVLKQIFRVAGEGTFTDKDQELLMKMVPTRKDTPAAAQAKITNIDNIVSAKLGIPAPVREWDTAAKGAIKPSETPRRRASDAEPPPGAVRRLPNG